MDENKKLKHTLDKLVRKGTAGDIVGKENNNMHWTMWARKHLWMGIEVWTKE
jgi:hypothetical protein